MKPGDVIVHEKHFARTHWQDKDGEDLLVLEEKPTIAGCIMVRGKAGDRCVNPRYFRVVRTLEERVAEEMMKPEVVDFTPRSFEDVQNKIMAAASRSLSIDLDQAILGLSKLGKASVEAKVAMEEFVRVFAKPRVIRKEKT